jgi:hypothetical protein
LGAHWIKEGGRSANESLDSLMQMDHVIRVDESGLVHDDVWGVYAPEISIGTADDGISILDEHEQQLIKDMAREGWAVESGWSGQNSGLYDGPIMHDSEFIGGHLAEHVIGTPGYWVACAVDVDSVECPNDSPACTLSNPCATCTDGTGNDRERERAGWVLLHRGLPEGGVK